MKQVVTLGHFMLGLSCTGYLRVIQANQPDVGFRAGQPVGVTRLESNT